MAKTDRSRSRRSTATRSRRVASSFPGSTALQAPTEYSVLSARSNTELTLMLEALHNEGWCIHSVLPTCPATGYTVISWRFTGAR